MFLLLLVACLGLALAGLAGVFVRQRRLVGAVMFIIGVSPFVAWYWWSNFGGGYDNLVLHGDEIPFYLDERGKPGQRLAVEAGTRAHWIATGNSEHGCLGQNMQLVKITSGKHRESTGWVCGENARSRHGLP